MNKKVSTKTPNSIFLIIVLVAGTFAAISPSFMTASAQDDSYYGGMDSYKKSYGKDVSVKKIDCSNVNVNVNGFELNVLPPTIEDLATSQALSADEGKESISIGSDLSKDDGDGQSDSDTNNRVVCISNNNNINVGEEQPPTPPEPTTASLTVTKTTTCNVQVFGDFCNFNPQLTVTGNTPTPSSFSASDTPVVVTLGAGAYSVSEEGFVENPVHCPDFRFDGGQQIGQIGNVQVYACTNFSDDCSGDIGIGEDLTCNIDNSIIGPIEDEEDLSALQKTTKLKQQWLDLLP